MENKEFSLRPLKLEDADRMLEWMRDPDITQHLQIGGANTKLETVVNFIQNSADDSENLHRAIVNSSDEYLGTVSLKHIDYIKKEAEYAIAMHASALGTGASTSASHLIIQLAFNELGLDRVYLNVLEDNQRAVKFYNKFGFQYINTSTTEVKGKQQTLLWFEVRK